MLDDLDTDIYFTCTLAYLDLTNGELVLCQAGHPHPLVVSNDGDIRMLGDGGPPVGLISGLAFENTKATLRKGDRLFLFSDGCSECTDPEDQMLGEDGLAQIVQKHGETPIETILDQFEADIRVFTKGREFEDDVSMIVLEYRD
jgi:sigma-B regulation protein RsbU (phosphoserine phosphatase)